MPELLEHAGKTRIELAKHLGVTKSYISQVIVGKKQLSVVNRKRAAEFLGCSSDDLNEWNYGDRK